MSFNRNLCLCLSLAAAAAACKKRDYGDAETKDLVGPNTAARYEYRDSNHIRMSQTLRMDFEALNPGYSIRFLSKRDRSNNKSGEFLAIHRKDSYVNLALSSPPVAEVEVTLGDIVWPVALLQENPSLLRNLDEPRQYYYYTLLVAEGNAWKTVSVGLHDNMSLCREESPGAFILRKDISGGVIDPVKTFKLPKCDLPANFGPNGVPARVINFKN